MKTKVLLLSVLTVVIAMFSCNKDKSYDQKILGTWQIDSIYYENPETSLKAFHEYVLNQYKEKLNELQDSVAKYSNIPNKTQRDSFSIMIYQGQLDQFQKMVDYYSDFENFKKDLLSSAQKAKGIQYTFEPDSVLIVPDANVQSKWYINGNTLTLQIGDFQVSADIKKLTNKEMIFTTSQDIDSNLSIVAVYELHKVKSNKNNK